MMNGTFEQLRAAVYGQAVGDALGVPYEFMPRDTFRCEGMTGYGTHNQPIGTWSDDTSMMLATLDSLIANEWQVNTEDMRERYLAWLSNGEYAIDGRVFDCGRTVSIALQQRVGLSGERDNGNGSLMRIMPLAFADASADDVRAASAITHAHAISMDACSSMVDVLRDGLIKGIWPQELDDEPLRGMPRDEVGSSGFVKDTYEAALWCLANTDDYASCVLAAVNLGDDTDTTAAVAGYLAGIKYGFDAIPAQWLSVLRGRELIEDVLGRTESAWH
ncbi:ADP-ribosylglycohydrolase family protein [Bifidobacterium longum]|uniref:ADP-ribosylglycohydrolase family protein n=1 Tax=Bifidobacterium longum TaxID=216816 RepID=UPI00095C6D2C|nr:ADP-ribosylglycohydrolase family protein [Bifidobacterium longum]OLR97083.1 ribosylglycohydrolase [Bifidobacterium longum subsp. longum]TCF67109.1 ADP-ribosylglycohydrolase family protein [Bifidobacterium longum subsp. longum]